MRLVLLSAAVGGDNSGDAIIESAVRQLIVADEFVRLPLTTSLGDAEIDEINGSDLLVICGTNLYQQMFACNLNEAVVDRINIPIIPFGIGASAPIGSIPKMNAAGVATVRAIHRKCLVSSVRDRASLRFLHSIGVDNTILTGCPVLFHSLTCPDFTPTGEGCSITPRARLLHIDKQWEARQNATLDLLCRRHRPTIVVQSPYDMSQAEELASRYGLPILQDPTWQAGPYIAHAQTQELTFGFRLHFAMLSIAYGKPAFVVAHDSRVSEFSELIGLPLFDIRTYSDNLLNLQIEARSFPGQAVQARWRELARQMLHFMSANGLPTRLTAVDPPAKAASHSAFAPKSDRPKIQLLADRRNWAFDHSARALAATLCKDYSFDLKYVAEKPRIEPSRCDLLHVFFWGEDYHRRFGFPPERIVKEVSSHRWEDDPRYGPCSAAEMISRYLDDCAAVLCTSRRLVDALSGGGRRVYHTPNGFDPRRFHSLGIRSGQMRIGWAGNADDPVKGLQEILEPACGERYPLIKAGGGLKHREMNAFYNAIDLFVVTSRHEGEPLPLIEAMATGCFPVCTDVGIVPELIRHQHNGFIVRERTPEAFAEAFDWCAARLDRIRAAGEENAREMARERSWQVCAMYFKWAYQSILERAAYPRFRNDDVSWDTDLVKFRQFSAIFSRYGMTQLHGVVLRGRTNVTSRHDGVPTEYAGHETIAKLDNSMIRQLSAGINFEDRTDLLEFLRQSSDELALHGLNHVDFSQMTRTEQFAELSQGLELMRQIFPGRRVRYFIPPFNRTNSETLLACRDLGLTLLGTEGVHLEAELETVGLQAGTWYRYHHHRFYPESTFDYYRLSLGQLEDMFRRNVSRQPRDLHLLPLQVKRNMLAGFLSKLTLPRFLER